MPVDYYNCDHLSPHNITKYGHMWRDIRNGQVQYVCNNGMFVARKLDAQFQQYNRTIHKTPLEEIPLLLSKFEEPKRCKRGILGTLF